MATIFLPATGVESLISNNSNRPNNYNINNTTQNPNSTNSTNSTNLLLRAPSVQPPNISTFDCHKISIDNNFYSSSTLERSPTPGTGEAKTPFFQDNNLFSGSDINNDFRRWKTSKSTVDCSEDPNPNFYYEGFNNQDEYDLDLFESDDNSEIKVFEGGNYSSDTNGNLLNSNKESSSSQTEILLSSSSNETSEEFFVQEDIFAPNKEEIHSNPELFSNEYEAEIIAAMGQTHSNNSRYTNIDGASPLSRKYVPRSPNSVTPSSDNKAVAPVANTNAGCLPLRRRASGVRKKSSGANSDKSSPSSFYKNRSPGSNGQASTSTDFDNANNNFNSGKFDSKRAASPTLTNAETRDGSHYEEALSGVDDIDGLAKNAVNGALARSVSNAASSSPGRGLRAIFSPARGGIERTQSEEGVRFPGAGSGNSTAMPRIPRAEPNSEYFGMPSTASGDSSPTSPALGRAVTATSGGARGALAARAEDRGEMAFQNELEMAIQLSLEMEYRRLSSNPEQAQREAEEEKKKKEKPIDLAKVSMTRQKFSIAKLELAPELLDQGCLICYEDYENEDIVVTLGCKGQHCFHKDCIEPWLVKSAGECPCCKEKVVNDDNEGDEAGGK